MNGSTDRVHLVYQARLAEQAERYDEMTSYMKGVVMVDEPLSLEERNLLNIAYKNSVGERRSAWRVVSSIEVKQQAKGESEFADLLQNYLMKEPTALPAESRVFYYKMMGDYYRYIAELCPTSRTNENPKLQAESAYRAGMEHAQELPAVHPVRLGLVLNFSVFYFEIMNEREEGCKMARQAFDEAVAGLDAASEESYRDAALVMQLLRDNLTLWTVESTPVDGLTKPDEKREGKTDN